MKVADPFISLYLLTDPKLSTAQAIDLYNFAVDIEDHTDGDFDIDSLTEEINCLNLSYVKIGLLAYKIKLKKLYKNITSSFQIYCENYLNSTVWQINRCINAARVVMDLALSGFTVLPKNESQARLLVNLSTEELIEIWEIVLEKFSPSDITAKNIATVINPNKEYIGKLQVSSELERHIKEQAKEEDLTVEEYLGRLTGMIPEQESESELDNKKEVEVKVKNLTNWHSDLDSLVQEEAATISILTKIIQFFLVRLRLTPLLI